jgi:DnaJ like chaperone protein
MDPLSWLGLRKKGGDYPNLGAIHAAVRELLPDDEQVIIRYIVIVAVLLTKVAKADGRVLECELDRLRALFSHIDRIPPESIDKLCDTLNESVSQLDPKELELCFRELKSLCDASERVGVMRLLARQATADGQIVASEHGELLAIARELGVPEDALEELELEALADDVAPEAHAETSTPGEGTAAELAGDG